MTKVKAPPTFWDYVFVTPDVYVRVLDFPYQVDMFDGYHRRMICRLVHLLSGGPSLFGWFLLLSHLKLGLVFLAVLSVWYLLMDFKTGLITIPIIAVMWAGANFVAGAAGASIFYWALALIGGASLLESLSHSVEDVPPPLSRRGNEWAPVSEWIAETPIYIKLVLLVWGTFLEAISAPRLFPVMVFVLLNGRHNRPAS